MKLERILVVIVRILLAAVFIFSGFAKLADPWGTAIKFDEYFHAFGIEWLSGGSLVFSVLLSALELTVGLALLSGIKIKVTSLVAMVFMGGFTLLTLYIALTDPVADCGCFGDVVKLTNWQTFAKNMILLPMSIVVYIYHRRLPRKMGSAFGWGMICFIFLISCGLGIYSIKHLPIVDSLPFKKGTDINAAMDGHSNYAPGTVSNVKLKYRNIETGHEQIFELSDTTWYDETKWEYVDTISGSLDMVIESSATDFVVFNAEEDITGRLLDRNAMVYLFVIMDRESIPGRCLKRMDDAARKATVNGAIVVAVTPEFIEAGETFDTGTVSLPLYNMDPKTMKTMLRANYGLVVLNGGVVDGKYNCVDIPVI